MPEASGARREECACLVPGPSLSKIFGYAASWADDLLLLPKKIVNLQNQLQIATFKIR
jgi:hypothetical protein